MASDRTMYSLPGGPVTTSAQTNDIDKRSMEHFRKTGKLLPEVQEMSHGRLDELMGYAEAPPGFDNALRELKRNV